MYKLQYIYRVHTLEVKHTEVNKMNLSIYVMTIIVALAKDSQV